MKYYIYIYTNKINNKQYIEQTNNIKRRQKQHKEDSYHNYSSARYFQPIHQAMRKYGIDNFSFDVIEEIISDNRAIVNEKENYWIKEKNTFAPNGYNISVGKVSNDIINKSSLSVEQIDQIFKDLKNNLSLKEVSIKHNLSESFISSINNGNRLYREDEKYPIQNNKIPNEYYLKVINMLINTRYSMAEIARQLNMNRETVRKINNGFQKQVQNLWDKEFPIRKDPKKSYNLKGVETIPSEIGSTTAIDTQLETVCLLNNK